MIVFSKNVNGFNHNDKSLTDMQKLKDFKNEMKRLENKYTSYGCYCYITGPDSGVHGGGKARDEIDSHCKELYQCYKVQIVNIHFSNLQNSVWVLEISEFILVSRAGF